MSTEIILMIAVYLPVIIFAVSTIGLMGRIKVLDSSLMLISMILSGLSILGVFNLWLICGQLFPALFSVGTFIFLIWGFFRAKGIENQIKLAINEETLEGNFTLTSANFFHVSYDAIERTIDILKDKGLISHKVMYSEPKYDENVNSYEAYEDNCGDAISNFEKRHNLRR